ncbi:MAG: ABC transporter permease [candidate division GAL15 bacterium]
MARAAEMARLRVRRPPRSAPPAVLLLLPSGLFLAAFFLVPYGNMVRMSFLAKAEGAAFANGVTLENYLRILQDAFYWRVIGRTFWLAGLSTVLTLLLGYPVAYAIARAPGPRRPLLLMLLLAPLLVGAVVRSYGWMILLGRVGLINQTLRILGVGEVELMYNTFGVVIGLVHVYLPFMVLALASALEQIPAEVELAARSLGAAPWRTFWRVTWPLSLPGVFSGSMLVFVLALSAYVIPILLGGNNVLVMPILIVQMLLDAFNWPVGSAMAMVLFGLACVVLLVYVKTANRVLRWIGR